MGTGNDGHGYGYGGGGLWLRAQELRRLKHGDPTGPDELISGCLPYRDVTMLALGPLHGFA